MARRLRVVSEFGFVETQIGFQIPVAGSVNGEIVQSRSTLWIGDIFRDTEKGRSYPRRCERRPADAQCPRRAARSWRGM